MTAMRTAAQCDADNPARCTIIVMAKAPLPGYAKTRLIPALGEHGAAALAACLLERAVDQALAAALGTVELCCAPDASHPALARHAGWPGLVLAEQGEGDLGVRMARAFERWLPHCGRVLLVGTDAPDLDAALLKRAAAALHDADAVFVPAFDGGYALVGLRLSAPSLFEGIAWSTRLVMAQTRERLAAAALRHVELPSLPDIDFPGDLVHLPAGWRGAGVAAGAGANAGAAARPTTNR